jgi:D-beta-D-heptose 7-phosphate kinase/D-beta-D-heptose 1-phosphate adenosyltransferase
MNILLFGDIVIDRNYKGNINRISPEGPYPIVNINNISDNLGCLGNVLNNVYDFYDKIYLITCINNKTIKPLTDLFKEKIIHENFHQENRELIIKNRIYSNNQCISRFDQEIINDIDINSENNIKQYIESIITNINIVILSDYAKGSLTKNICQYIINICNKNKIYTLIDPKGTDYSKYKNCTLIKPNKKEANDFYKQYSNEFNILDFSNKLLDEYNIKYILNTLSSDGMRFIYKENNEIKIIKKNIISSEVIDVIGCGDTIISTISVYLSNQKLNINELLNILTNIGSIAVNTSSCYIFKKKDYKNKIIFTNGCFDIVHIGHIKYLKECKKLGKLIIGINSDESIKRLKGKERPINKLNDRINFLKELNIADEIIPFEENTPENLIKKVKPNILVKGGDYKIEDIIGREYVNEVKIIPFVNGYSSTNIINTIKNQ